MTLASKPFRIFMSRLLVYHGYDVLLFRLSPGSITHPKSPSSAFQYPLLFIQYFSQHPRCFSTGEFPLLIGSCTITHTHGLFIVFHRRHPLRCLGVAVTSEWHGEHH